MSTEVRELLRELLRDARELLRDSIEEAHGHGLIRDHPLGTGPLLPFAPLWKLCPNQLCVRVRASLAVTGAALGDNEITRDSQR